MAIARMKKVYIFSYEKGLDPILEKLQKMGVLEVEDTRAALNLGEEESKREDLGSDFDKRIGRSIDFLSGFESRSKGIIDSFIPEKIPVMGVELERPDGDDVLNEVEKLHLEMEKVEKAEKDLLDDSKEIAPWENVNLNFEDLKEREHVKIGLYSMEKVDFEDFRGELNTLKPSPIFIEALEVKREMYFVLIYSKKVAEEIQRMMESQSIKVHSLSFRGAPSENLNRIEKELKDQKKRKEVLKKKAEALLKDKKKILLLYDSALIEKEKKKIAGLLAKTEHAVVISGWIPEKYVEKLNKELKDISDAIEVISREPLEGEKAPVVLENRLSEPFEAVTDLYGMPSYQELDPTPYLAPFFFIFFGFALGDAGYGIILSILSFRLIGRTENKGAKKLFRLLVLGGISTFILGVLTGSWFGNFFVRFPVLNLGEMIEKLRLIDPLEDPILMLILALALGFIQVFFGTGLKAYKSLLRHEQRKAVSQGSFLLILLSIVAILLNGKLMEAGKIVFYGSAAILFVTSGIKGALIMLYSLIGYLGDVLSYSRLLALGLATGVIAIVVNEIASIALSIPYIGVLAAFLVLLLGHTFNIAINVLGAFIHSSRLQFVEFFTKFLEGGGRIFKPFVIKTKYTEVKKW